MALHWNGSSLAVASPSLAVKSKFTGVSALASNNVWAVGRIGANSLVEHWTGSWSRVAVPDPNPANPAAVDSLSAVSARAASDVWAVGSATTSADPTVRTLTLQWDGVSWTRVPSPPPGAGNLTSVSTRPGAAQVPAAGGDASGFGFVMSHP